MAKPILIILGNQLFPLSELPGPQKVSVFMCEDRDLCTYVRHHQQKIVLYLSAMRSYADELENAGYDVDYVRLDATGVKSYEYRLRAAMSSADTDKLVHFEVEDKAMERRLIDFADQQRLQREELRSPMFLTSRQQFADYASANSRLMMGEFYRIQRRRLNILVDRDGNPTGGRWSFDEDNRKKLPASILPPAIDSATRTRNTDDAIEVVKSNFSDHPGDASEFWLPTSRAGALRWLEGFLDSRLENFGPYEDAISTRSDTLFHSVLTPVLNLGLVTPGEVVDKVLRHAELHDVQLQSLEGFIRQIIGWREFVRGVYREFGDKQDSTNFWSHNREFTDAWYSGNTGIPPLDDTIRTAQRLGWTHHIPRLMVLGNLMTLCEINPQSAHRWFMEMYVDSSEWVMGPNVYGMGLFSDGGLFATKPYICGSNYLLKMSDYRKGEWCDTVDGLYWRFIGKHRDFFSGNPRLALMPRALDRLDAGRRTRILDAADEFLEEYTT